MSRPKVLFVSGNAPPVIDGVGDYTAHLVATLKKQRPEWDWQWLCRRPRWWWGPLTRIRGVFVMRPGHTWREFSKRLAARTVRALRPDILHVQDQIHSFHETDAAVRLAAAAPGTVITTLHEFHNELASVVHTIELVKRSDLVVANDARNARRCREHASRVPDYQWWSGPNVSPPPPEWNVRAVPRLVTTFGQISGLKSLELVYAALAQVRERHGELQWRIVGPFEPHRRSDHRDLAMRFSDGWVTFTGAIPRRNERMLRTLLGETTMMALPFKDGASLRRTTLHTAWAFGHPVITTPPPDDEPEIRDGENCLLVHEATPAAWAAAIERVLKDATLAERLRAGSRATAEKLSWERLSRLHLEMYETVLGNHL